MAYSRDGAILVCYVLGATVTIACGGKGDLDGVPANLAGGSSSAGGNVGVASVVTGTHLHGGATGSNVSFGGGNGGATAAGGIEASGARAPQNSGGIAAARSDSVAGRSFMAEGAGSGGVGGASASTGTLVEAGGEMTTGTSGAAGARSSQTDSTARAGSSGSSQAPECTSVTLQEVVASERCQTYLPAYSASATAVVLWIEDGTAATGAGGYVVTLTGNQSVTAGGHNYSYSVANSLFGDGGYYFGYLEIGVDGAAAQIRFDVQGCPTSTGDDIIGFSARVGRQRLNHFPTEDVVSRSFSITAAPNYSYTFTNRQSPASCGLGIDLLGWTLGLGT